MTIRMATTLSEATLGSPAMESVGAPATAAIPTGYTEIRSRLARWLARKRVTRRIAHLDDRLLADAGFSPRDLGFGERLVRNYAAGGGIWAAGKTRP